jgi:hypothetical protein
MMKDGAGYGNAGSDGIRGRLRVNARMKMMIAAVDYMQMCLAPQEPSVQR